MLTDESKQRIHEGFFNLLNEEMKVHEEQEGELPTIGSMMTFLLQLNMHVTAHLSGFQLVPITPTVPSTPGENNGPKLVA